MEPKIQSSFIPKSPVTLGNKPKRRRSAVGPLFIFSLLALIISGVFWGGLLGYLSFLSNAIAQKGEQLERARTAFAPALIQEIERLDQRLITAEELTDNHIAPSILFSILEESMLQTVQFKSLVYSMLPDGSITLRAEGLASSFSSIALQSDVFEQEQVFVDPRFSSFALVDSGDIAFAFDAAIDKNILLYTNLVSASDIIQSPAEETTPTATSTGGVATSTEQIP